MDEFQQIDPGIVKNTLRQLVEHFDQPVHLIPEVSGDLFGANNNPPPPHFDAVLGRKPELSPTVRFWLDRLSSVSMTTQEGNDPDPKHIIEWIDGYELFIRPLLLKATEGCVPVLQQYELTLTEWLRRITHQRSDRFIIEAKEVGESEQEHADSRISALLSTTLLPQLSRSIDILSTDITLMTSERLFPNFSAHVRSNVVIPTILRLLDRVFEIQAVFAGVELGSPSLGTNSHLKQLVSSGFNTSCLRRCVVSLLAFEGGHVAPPDISPALAGDIGRGGIDSLCQYPPTDLQPQEIALLHHRFLSLKSIDWTTVSLSGALWNDPDTGIAARAAEDVWRQLGTLLLENDNSTDCEDRRNTRDTESGRLPHMVRKQAIVRVLGVHHILQDVRKHFFGRDMIAWEPPLHTSQQVVLGRRVTKSRPVVDEKPFQAVPSRIAVAMNLLRLLDRTERNTLCSWRDFNENLFPICATLLDSTSATTVALGATGMLELVEFLDGTKGVVQFGSDHGHESSEIEAGWKTFVDESLSVLERAFQATHEGPVIVAIGQAQSSLLNSLQNWKDSRWDGQRRRITGQWLFRLQRSSYRHASQAQCWELLVGGVVPLLRQHARNELTDADSMEMGRMGLSALLPLIDGEFVDDKTQVLSLVALINLMLGAYPIMPHHGGKVMCCLLAAIARIRGESKVDLVRKKLTVHAAAVALVICGPKFTDSVLDEISSNPGQYQETLVEATLLVRNEANNLRRESV